MKRVLIAAGGTGGHVFPALAVAHALQERGIEVSWVCSTRGLEEKVVAPHFSVTYLSISALRGKGWRGYLLLPFRLCRAVIQAINAIKHADPDVVLTMGSFVSGPTGVAAKLLHVPLIIHEQNAIPGMTNRVLKKMANKVLQAFPDSFLPAENVVTVGNPVRAELLAASLNPRVSKTEKTRTRLLVLGGSQGAAGINASVLSWWKEYGCANDIELWHQVGVSHYSKMKQQYETVGKEVQCDAFIDKVSTAYQWADIVVCRSGALTVAEVAIMGVAAIFIPFPAAVDDHQYHNAKWLVDKGAAIVMRQSECNVQSLQCEIALLHHNQALRLKLAESARGCATYSSTENIIFEMRQLSVN